MFMVGIIQRQLSMRYVREATGSKPRRKKALRNATFYGDLLTTVNKITKELKRDLLGIHKF